MKVVVDSYFDRRSAYEFAVNPVGVKRDRYYYNDGPSDDSWDAVWDVQVSSATAEGWTRGVPDSVLAAALQQHRGRAGGIRASIREIARLNEISTWPLLSRNANGFVSQFARDAAASGWAAPRSASS